MPSPRKKGRPKAIDTKHSNKTHQGKLAQAMQKLTQLDPNDKEAQLVRRRAAIDIVNQTRKLAGKALRTIEQILDSPEAQNRDRLTAAKMILDRAYGKAPQATLHAVVANVKEDQLQQVAAQILKRRGVVIDADK